jgi:hypothetical protein
MRFSSSFLAAGMLATVATAAPSYFDRRADNVDFVGVLPRTPGETPPVDRDCHKPSRGGQSPRGGRGGRGGAHDGGKTHHVPTPGDNPPDGGSSRGRGGMTGGRGGTSGGRGGRGGRGGSAMTPATGSE